MGIHEREDVTSEEVVSLLQYCRRTAEQGLAHVMLVKTCKRRPRTNNVRVLPGCMGRVVGSTAPGKYLVDVPLKDLVAALERVMISTSDALGVGPATGWESTSSDRLRPRSTR